MSKSNTLLETREDNPQEIVINNYLTVEELETPEQDPVVFRTYFNGMMEMYSDEETVINYLNDHQGWFVRCASPMKAEPFGENGYTLTIGHYGAFGYNVNPQINVVLDPPEPKYYSMYSVSNSEFDRQGYEVDYRSIMEIESIPPSQAVDIEKVYHQKGKKTLPESITKINWQLDLQVKVKFPPFIYKLPMSIIKTTGDRLLSEIVKQISPRLTYKVQKDFHSRFDLPIPPKSARTFQRLTIDN